MGVLTRIIGKLSLALIFILAESPEAALMLVVCPVVLIVFLVCRENSTKAAVKLQAEDQNMVVHQVTDTVQNYRLIADFAMRPMIIDKYEKIIDVFQKSESDMLVTLTNNSF